MRKALFMKQPTKVSVQTYLEKSCQNLAWKCFQLNLILSFYRFVHFRHFSGIKICKICDTLPFLTQNLLLNPPLFLSVFLDTDELFSKTGLFQNSYHGDQWLIMPSQRLNYNWHFSEYFSKFFFIFVPKEAGWTRSEDYLS